MKKALISLSILIGVPVFAFGCFLLLSTLRDYNPKPVLFVPIEGEGTDMDSTKSDFSFLIWNIGYAGLGVESDFFFDGGTGVRQSETVTQKNLDGIVSFLKKEQTRTDFILLQEVDFNSKRSWYTDQSKVLTAALSPCISSLAYNYVTDFVPQPLTNPYGKCSAGLMSFTHLKPGAARRIALTPDATWPVGLFMLDRCLLEWRFKLRNSKELIVYNLHLSAYDDGTVKQNQMDSLKKRVLKEYEAGNYVVVGGDWNQNPPGYISPNPGVKATVQMSIPEDYPAKGWKWAFGSDIPTNRKLNEPYKEGTTGIDVIDFYLISPNLQVLSHENINLGFAYSDHQPVYMKIRIPELYVKPANAVDSIPADSARISARHDAAVPKGSAH